MSNNNNNNSAGASIGFSGFLTIVFIVLKLTGVITWSWVWVLSPLWIGLAISVLLILVFAIICKIAKKISR